MKWIKSRENWLNEAKLRDVIFKQQAEEVKKTWGEKFLDYEEVTPTDKIKQGKWKLSEEDNFQVLNMKYKLKKIKKRKQKEQKVSTRGKVNNISNIETFEILNQPRKGLFYYQLNH